MKEDIRQAAAEEAALLNGAARYDISGADGEEVEKDCSESTVDYNKKDDMPNPTDDEIWASLDLQVHNLKDQKNTEMLKLALEEGCAPAWMDLQHSWIILRTFSEKAKAGLISALKKKFG